MGTTREECGIQRLALIHAFNSTTQKQAFHFTHTFSFKAQMHEVTKDVYLTTPIIELLVPASVGFMHFEIQLPHKNKYMYS